MSEEATQEQTASDADKRRLENKLIYTHIRGLVERAYSGLRTVDWDGFMALIEPAAEHDAGEAIPMFRTVRDFMHAFRATKQPAQQIAPGSQLAEALIGALLEQLCGCPECAAKRAHGAPDGQVH